MGKKLKILIGIVGFFIILAILGCSTPSSRVGEPAAIQEFTFIKTDDGNYKFLLVLIDDEQREIAASGTLTITIKDKFGNVLYTQSKHIDAEDFKTYRRVLTGAPIFGYSDMIFKDEVKKGFSSSGVVEVVFKTDSGKILKASDETHSLPKMSDEELKRYFENEYLKNATEINKIIKKEGLELTIIRCGWYETLKFNELKKYFRIDVKVRNYGSEVRKIYASGAKLIDENGRQYDTRWDSEFKGGEIQPNAFIEGYLLFENVPEDVKEFKLVWKDGYISGEGYLTFEVKFKVS